MATPALLRAIVRQPIVKSPHYIIRRHPASSGIVGAFYPEGLRIHRESMRILGEGMCLYQEGVHYVH
jgi:hypothetical protein